MCTPISFMYSHRAQREAQHTVLHNILYCTTTLRNTYAIRICIACPPMSAPIHVHVHTYVLARTYSHVRNHPYVLPHLNINSELLGILRTQCVGYHLHGEARQWVSGQVYQYAALDCVVVCCIVSHLKSQYSKVHVW